MKPDKLYTPDDLRQERFYFYQMGLKRAREIAVEAHDAVGQSWNAFHSAAQDGARQAAKRILKGIDSAIKEEPTSACDRNTK